MDDVEPPSADSCRSRQAAQARQPAANNANIDPSRKRGAPIKTSAQM